MTSQQLAPSHPATPKAFEASQNVTGQQAAGSSVGRGFGGEIGSLLETIPRDEKGFAFMSAMVKALGATLDDTGVNAGSQEQSKIMQTFSNRLKDEMQGLLQAHPPASSSQACVPIAAPCAPPKLQGAASSAPPPSSFLPAGMPPLPIAGGTSPVRGRPSSQTQSQGARGRSGSSESSSPSRSPPPPFAPPDDPGNPPASSSWLPPSGATCRICGGQHEEIHCPYLSMNQQNTAPVPSNASTGTRNYADEEEDTIRVKSLSDITFPMPPRDAAQARGYVNQVLMSIGKLQKTHGHEVYAWAQECLTHDEAVLKADPRFPRTDREIAAKLIKTCKTGRFGILFQQMVETERSTTGGMPCGRVMLRIIFKHFQLERDRIGMLGERNLLQLKVPGKNVSDLEAFRQKYNYILQTIPASDLPKEQTLFNHLIDELEKSPVMAYKVQKSREAPVGSHRRTTTWLWDKVDLAIELEQQKKNRADFDRQLQLKPQDGYSGTAGSSEVPGAPAPTGAALSKKERAAQKAAEKAEKDRKEKEKKEKEKKKREKEAAKAAALAAAAKAPPKKAPPPKPPRNPRRGDRSTTPRGEEATRASKMTPEEKAKTPCMFFAYNMCKAKSCAFLHSNTQKYQGPPPRVLGKDGKAKAPAKVAASVAPLVSAQVSSSSSDIPQVNAMPLEVDQKIPWLWDTAAGRHIIGRQALSPSMKSCLRKSVSPVAFATGGVLNLAKNR